MNLDTTEIIVALQELKATKAVIGEAIDHLAAKLERLLPADEALDRHIVNLKAAVGDSFIKYLNSPKL